jgi:ribonuclease HII
MLLPFYKHQNNEAGTDEAGRGCLAGPVTAAAIILPVGFENNLLNDSKKLSEKTRFDLKPLIETMALSFAVTHISPDIIDEINILNAAILAMQKSVLKLNPIPIYIIVDGNRPVCPLIPQDKTIQIFEDTSIPKLTLKKIYQKFHTANDLEILKSIPNTSIIKGDEKYLSIAAASILAKTYRDEYMNQIHEEYPMYGWNQNKGYPTKAHREAIKKYGTTKYHRKSFKML